jgi:hypothetical protein
LVDLLVEAFYLRVEVRVEVVEAVVNLQGRDSRT